MAAAGRRRRKRWAVVPKKVIEIHGLTKVYTMGEVEVRALAGLDLVVDSGEFLAVMGPSGSGKSTLMNILGCLDRPTAGTYLLDGVDVSTLDRDERAVIRNAKIGFVFQSFNLLARTSRSRTSSCRCSTATSAGRASSGARRRSTRCIASDWPAASTTSRRNSPAASSSASPSPARSSPIRPSSSPTSRPAISTRARPKRSWASFSSSTTAARPSC